MTGDDDTPRYGVCPNGHGDENGIIAAEVSADARPHPNCPICGASLEHADDCTDDHAWCVGPDGPTIDGQAFGGKCSTCALDNTGEA